ncbi:MAG: metallophosphoesterase family protein [Hominenteromicrobium sp.]
MRLAVFSDIHSNHLALEACFREAERRKAEMWIFLGDYVSDCAYPHKTMELLYKAKKEHDCRFVKGNREEYILDHHRNGSDWNYNATSGSLLYTYENMTADDLAFIDALPVTDVIRLPGRDVIRICHGAPYKTRVLLEPGNGMAARVLRDMEEPVLLGGHSHKPFFERAEGKLYVNPGSVGVQTCGSVESEMAFLESDGQSWSPQLVRVPYDNAAAAQELEESGLLHKSSVWAPAIAKQLVTGENLALFCLLHAEKLAEGGAVTNAHLRQAARELGVL